MKKSYFVVTALLVLVAAGDLGISFGLRPLVEEQVMRGVQGLSISYDIIVNVHKGHIGFTSDKRGTIFRIELPVNLTMGPNKLPSNKARPE